MKRRDPGKGGVPADLLVCFPTKAHLKLLPKPVYSPARPSEPMKPSHQHHHHHRHRHHLNHNHHLKKSVRAGGSHVSPHLWVKNKQMGSDTSEPTSPKVTCAGQIKVRPRPGPCKNWQSVMEEIERIHNKQKKKKPGWGEVLGFKKDIMHFLTCLRSVRFDFRCFGAYPNNDITSDDDEEEDVEEEEEEDEKHHVGEHEDDEGSSTAVFSKWFMLLQENPNKDKENEKPFNNQEFSACAPPPNALLLMRCRSAPAKSWQEEKEEEEDKDMDEAKEEEEDDDQEEEKFEAKVEKKKRESLEELMRHESEFHKFSCDLAKETWVVGGVKDLLLRSRSCRR